MSIVKEVEDMLKFFHRSGRMGYTMDELTAPGGDADWLLGKLEKLTRDYEALKVDLNYELREAKEKIEVLEEERDYFKERVSELKEEVEELKSKS